MLICQGWSREEKEKLKQFWVPSNAQTFFIINERKLEDAKGLSWRIYFPNSLKDVSHWIPRKIHLRLLEIDFFLLTTGLYICMHINIVDKD